MLGGCEEICTELCSLTVQNIAHFIVGVITRGP